MTVFRPVGDETHCGPCRRTAAASAPPAPRTGSWRTLAEQVSASA
ncbi:hypothetical protein ACFT5C_17700 [Streptomyces sp. NPDC057116]